MRDVELMEWMWWWCGVVDEMKNRQNEIDSIRIRNNWLLFVANNNSHHHHDSYQARPNIDATSPVDCEWIIPFESLLANLRLLAVDNFRAAYKRCNEYGCWISCCELLTAAAATALATLSISVVDAVKPFWFLFHFSHYDSGVFLMVLFFFFSRADTEDKKRNGGMEW